jgi:hypothetical protein
MAALMLSITEARLPRCDAKQSLRTGPSRGRAAWQPVRGAASRPPDKKKKKKKRKEKKTKEKERKRQEDERFFLCEQNHLILADLFGPAAFPSGCAVSQSLPHKFKSCPGAVAAFPECHAPSSTLAHAPWR